MDNKMKFDIKLTDIEPVNPLFSKAKCYVMYHGDNRNKSAMKKEDVEKAIPTLFNCPVIGEWNETLEDFRGHGGKVEISQDGIKYIQTTRPYGLIPESTDTAWEFVTESDGSVREYLTCTVYLWTGRYPEAESIIANGKGQSMEIEDIQGFQREDGIFQIESFVFSALCVLGDDVEPCFEGASVVAYALDKDTFTSEFNLMVRELKDTLNESTASDNKEQDGGVQMENEGKENLENFSTEQVEGVENKPESTEGQFESAEGTQENAKSNGGAEQNDENHSEEFALSTEQLKAEIKRNLRSNTFKDDWGWECQNFYYVDYDEEFVYAEDEKNRYLVALSYSVSGDIVSIDFNSAKRVKITYTALEDGSVSNQFELIPIERNEYETKKTLKDKEEVIFALNKQLADLTIKFEVLEKEAETLREKVAENESAQIQEQKESIFEEFSVGLTVDEMKPIRDEMDKLSVTDIEVKLNKIFTSKNLAKIKKEQFTELPDTVNVDVARKETSKSRYAV